MSHLSRRSLVASAVALPVLAVPVVAVAVSAEPDPIFAAIERWNLPQLAEAVTKALSIARDRGLIPADSEGSK